MTDKIVTIGPYQLGALHAFTDVVNLDLLLQHLPKLDANALFYTSILQSGASRFDLCEDNAEVLPRSDFLKKRIKILPPSSYGKHVVLIDSVFAGLLPESYKSEKRYAPVLQLQSFLADLCFAMERKTSMVLVLTPPKLENLKPLLPPELFIPLRSLMSTLEPQQLSVPLPKLSITHDNLAVFVQLLKSDLFQSYIAAQVELDFAPIPQEYAIAKIGRKANQMVRQHFDTLVLKNTTVALLPITAKIIDLVFGKLPGAIAEHSGNLLTGMLKENRRVVVYQFHPIFEDVITTRFQLYLDIVSK